LLVSILVPTRNEEAWIRKTLDALLADVVGRDDAEILCIDGLSTDGTRGVIAEYAARDPRVRLVDNPGLTLPKALNLGIRHARGRVVLRMDAHAECAPGYVWKNVELLDRTGAECVGGYLKTEPGAPTAVGRAIAAALSSSFGVGGTRSRVGGGREQEADEATFGCWRRDLFDRIGWFDERLTRNQDMEFFCRIRNRGGRIIISPEIQATYFCRHTFTGMREQAFENGRWGPYTLWLAGGGLRPRHLAPLALVLSILGLGVLGVFWRPAWALLAAELLGYLAAGLAMAVAAARKAGASALLIWLSFIQLHVSYGAGSLWGLLTAPLKFGLRPRPPSGSC